MSVKVKFMKVLSLIGGKMDWKEKLRKDGYINVGEFVVELSLDMECPCKDGGVYPAITVYDHKTERWYYIDEPFESVNNFREAWEIATKTLEGYIEGKTPRLKRSPKKLAPDDVINRFIRALKELKE